MTYYKILQYLKKNGLDDGKAHYVRNMVRELVKEEKQEYAKWAAELEACIEDNL
jgi:hypothetical protein